ncbi:MAG: DNA-binding transcriptional regulator Fis [Gammaproteobacteria bacterium]|nr:DNA-binding transcriptional regulator Fis [Gammaproteobacteria bacterium]
MNKGSPPLRDQAQTELIDDFRLPASNENNDASPQTLRSSVEKALENYFAQLDGQMVTDLYALFLSEVEAPLLECVLKYAGNNQSKTAELLGLNRGTLRKKLKKYGYL